MLSRDWHCDIETYDIIFVCLLLQQGKEVTKITVLKENLQAFVTALYNVCNDQLTEGFSQCSLIQFHSIEHSFVIYSYGLSTD